MLLDLAKTWINRMLRFPDARQRVLRLFEMAAADGVQATVGVGRELTSNGKGCLVRWTGTELVVLELSAHQQAGFGLQPNGIFQHYEDRRSLRPEMPAERLLTLSSVQIGGGGVYDAREPLVGTCQFAYDEAVTAPCASCALRAQYFRPRRDRQPIMYYHLTGPLLERSGRLKFAFRPLAKIPAPEPFSGTSAVFLQLVMAGDGATPPALKPVSNVAASVIDIRWNE